ncbi:hypothetical protein FQN54_009751 [Arachnomyces sp. PD_36]|nr:hypothetical protein FQN54_009751 [Arachnomyces sp. PD_36]
MISLADLEPERAAILRGVLSSLLRSDLVQNIFAQVIDGIPTESTYEFALTMRDDILSRTEPSQESTRRSLNICQSQEILDTVDLNSTVAQRYQDAVLFSPAFNLRLLELAAIAIHTIAGNLYAAFNPNGEPEPSEVDEYTYRAKNAISLSTTWYVGFSRYPRGFLDVVGYWAELHIFGGVVVFDRGPEEESRNFVQYSAANHNSSKTTQSYAAYIHPKAPRQLYQLSESQLERFSSLGITHRVTTEQVTVEEELEQHLVRLPFTLESDARRVDHIAAFRDLNIYRDRYERYITAPRWGQCVVRLEDHPELREFCKKANEMYDDMERERDP